MVAQYNNNYDLLANIQNMVIVGRVGCAVAGVERSLEDHLR